MPQRFGFTRLEEAERYTMLCAHYDIEDWYLIQLDGGYIVEIPDDAEAPIHPSQFPKETNHAQI